MSWRLWSGFAFVAVIGGILSIAWALNPLVVPKRDLVGLMADIDRGAYVARLAGCVACHTNIKKDGAVLAGGGEIATVFGSFYAPNITPHSEDGIGAWTLDDFSGALTAGVRPDGSHYFPVFPYDFYTRLTDQDLVDLWAAIRAVPPVSGKAPRHDLNFPFVIRTGVQVWKWLYFNPDPLRPVNRRSDKWHRGRYLAEVASHCGACHTPRNFFGGLNVALKFQGGIGPDSEKVPAITPQALISKGWTAGDLKYAFRTGLTPQGDSLSGSMAEVIREGTKFWNDDDIAALTAYLLGSHEPQ